MPQSGALRQHPKPFGTQLPAWSGKAQSAAHPQIEAPEQKDPGPHCASRQHRSGEGVLQMVETQI